MADPRYSIIPARAVYDHALSPMDLRVLTALGRYTDNQGWCYPSQKELTEGLNIARSTLGAALKKLVDLGYVVTAPRTIKGRGKVGNLYLVKMDAAAPVLPMTDAPDIGVESAQKPNKKPMSDTSGNGADVRHTGQPMSATPDIVYNDRTTPIERPQLCVGDGKLEALPLPKPKAFKKTAAAYPDEFQAVWMKWPSKRRERSDKSKAFERWEKGRQRWGAGLIAVAVDRYLADPDVRKENYRYCCLAEVFMNGKLEAAVEAAHAAATGAVESRKVWSSEEQAWVLRPA